MGKRFTAVKNGIIGPVKAVYRYTTDGCSFVPNFNCRDCCEQHDQDYAKYHRTSEKKRAEIDRRLRRCMQIRGRPILAWVYWAGVRAFGWIPFWVLARRERLIVEED
jgi:hypothetical protein